MSEVKYQRVELDYSSCEPLVINFVTLDYMVHALLIVLLV